MHKIEAIIIGGIAGAICYLAVRLRARTGLDDSLDVVAVHGVGGTWGALATGLFATKDINGVADGLFYGNPGQLGIQAIAVLATWVLAFVGTVVLLKIVDAVMGLRVSPDEEQVGIDLSQHEENAYAL